MVIEKGGKLVILDFTDDEVLLKLQLSESLIKYLAFEKLTGN